jgi:hypothetical protein
MIIYGIKIGGYIKDNATRRIGFNDYLILILLPQITNET